MPEVTPQQLDEYRHQQAVQAALSRHMQFDTPLVVIKAKPRKTRSDKQVQVPTDAPQQPPLTQTCDQPNVAA